MDHDLRHDHPAPETPHDLRSPEARLLEAARRGMDGDGHTPDVRTFDQVVIAELVRLVDTIQTLSLRQDVFEEELAELVRLVDAIQPLSLLQDVFEEELAGRRDAVNARLSRLEESLKRVADGLQVLILRLDDQQQCDGTAGGLGYE